MFKASGLSRLVGQNLVALQNLHIIALVLVMTIIGATVTTFVVNAASATVLLPIMFQLVSHLESVYSGL